MAEYQMALSREIDSRLKTKCDKVADAFIMDDIGRLSIFPFHFVQFCKHVLSVQV